MNRRINFILLIVIINICSCTAKYNVREINKYLPPLKNNRMGIAWFDSSGSYYLRRNSRMEQWWAVQMRNKGYNVVATLAHFEYDSWAYQNYDFVKKTKKAIIEAAREKDFDCVLIGIERPTRSLSLNNEIYMIELRVFDTTDKSELVSEYKTEERKYHVIGKSTTVRTTLNTTTQTPIEYTESMNETRDKLINHIISQF